MKKLRYVIFFFSIIFISKTSFCQPFDCSKDDEISTIYGEEYGINVQYEYATHWLSPMLDSSSLNDTVYLQNVIDFIQSRHSLIKVISLDTVYRRTAFEFFESKGLAIEIIPADYSYVGFMDVRLNDTMDAIMEINIFSNAGLFRYVDYHPVSHVQNYPLEPTDPYWQLENQWYFKQMRSNTNPNHFENSIFPANQYSSFLNIGTGLSKKA